MTHNISGVFASYKRPHLTQLVLDQFRTIGGDDFLDECIATTGPDPDPEYLSLLDATGLFDDILVQQSDETAHDVWTRAHDLADGPWYFYFQNDHYITTSDAFDAMIDAMDHVAYCRLNRQPMEPEPRHSLTAADIDFGIYEGAYAFDHSPGLRRTQFPFTDAIDGSDGMMGERACAEAWSDSQYQTGQLVGDAYQRNLGLFGSDGKPHYLVNNNNVIDRFFAPGNAPSTPIHIDSLIDTFDSFASSHRQSRLFREYIYTTYSPESAFMYLGTHMAKWPDAFSTDASCPDASDTPSLSDIFSHIDQIDAKLDHWGLSDDERAIIAQYASCLPHTQR